VRPPVPSVNDPNWIRTPLDRFILATLEQMGLKPAPNADRAMLLRRVTIDLTGLPPTPEETQCFLEDNRPDAYVRVVERLLASPAYGERWAQHWLDVARYAESNGYELDAERPHAWHYRDYVIRAFQDDLPFDQFVTEQLAGDLLPRSNDRLVATGFNRCGPIHLVSGNTDPEVNRQEVLTEMTGSVGSAFLGLTIGCARCHDHKFDPISQTDYYQLQAFFAASKPNDVDIATAAERHTYEERNKALQAELAPLRKQVAEMEKPYKALLTELKRNLLEAEYRAALDVEPAKRSPEQKKLAENAQILIKVSWDELVEALTLQERAKRAELRARIHALEAQLPPPPSHAWAVTDDDKVPPTFVLKRGDPKRKGKQVHAALPSALTNPMDTSAAATAADSGPVTRLELAHWLTRRDQPLTARVLVNRLWQHHFGRGLVATPNDFGIRGERPSHPALLDWLACEFVEHDWSIKHMHRLMVLSNTYQQTSRLPAGARAKDIDPDNRWLSRMNRHRLEGETLRDSALSVAGTLNPKMGGPMVRVPLEPEVYDLIFTEAEPDGLWHVTPDRREHSRRTIYLFAKRNVRLPMLEAFDQPDTLTSCPVRPVSTFAPQALILLNGPFLQEQSKSFAGRLLRECGFAPERLIDRAFRLALARPPRDPEMRLAREFLDTQSKMLRDRKDVSAPPDLPAGIDPFAAAALADLCLALFNRNEFLYVN
jgi:hypothetical protein